MPVTPSLHSSIVRIQTVNGTVVGAGFLVAERHLLTCAHVVSQVLGQPYKATPTGLVHLNFPFIARAQILTARVVIWQPKQPNGEGDIAGLELTDAPPAGARPIRLVTANNTWGHPFRAYGFPPHHDDGVWASGVLRDRKANGQIQIEATKTPGYAVEPGFSGTAVWDDELNGVVGMVIAAGNAKERRANIKAAFIIPTDKLTETWPELQIWTMPPNPYRGLNPFREEDAPFFFGREQFTKQLVKAIQHKSFVAVLGPSGSGKSSVVFAGLLPQIRQEGTVAIIHFRPGSRPFRNLVDAFMPYLEPDISATERLIKAGRLTQELEQNHITLHEVVSAILAQSRQFKRLLLVADQFEELYTLCPQVETRQQFIDKLLEGVAAQAGQYQTGLTLLLTMRADFLGQATAYRSFADALQDAAQILGPMTRVELTQAIEKPAQVAAVQFEAGLVTRILAEISHEPGHLPLLEFALTLLWEQQKNGVLTHKAYEAIGNVEGALARYADDVYSALNETGQEQARRIFVQLVQPGEGTEDTRRQATKSELGEVNWNLVRWLADARLVVTNRREEDKQDTAELVHEALIQGWRQLQEWMSLDRTFRAWQERLRVTLKQWKQTSRDEGALLRGLPLAEAEDWLAKRAAELSEFERDFISASIAQREQERAKQEAQRQRELEAARQLTDSERRRSLIGYIPLRVRTS